MHLFCRFYKKNAFLASKIRPCYTLLYISSFCISRKQWDGQIGNGHFFPTWASLSQWGIKFLFTEICGKYQDNNFQKKNLISSSLIEICRVNLKNPWGLPVGFLNPSTNPSKNQRVFFKTPQVNLTCMSWCWIFSPVLELTGLKNQSSYRRVFKKPVIVRTGLKNPSIWGRV